ncbi:Ig-like domain-containing protein [Blautia wexlerae]|uniref:Ig-like domain-containing protein n=1 Tax=Blautia wexlerae TaxID=418240 RepID=UPI0034A33E51
MKKKCFKKTVSWALSIVMSATMAVTPVLADTFTDGSQSIISGNAEIPAVDVESATDCGDVASTEENLTEPALLQEEEFDNPEHVEFSGGNDAEAVSEFSDDSVPAAQTEGNTVVYLDPNSGNDAHKGENSTTAVSTLERALELAESGGTIYLLNSVDIDKSIILKNVTLCPGTNTLTYMLKVNAGSEVTLENVKINNSTPENSTSENSNCIFSENPIQVSGTLTIKDGTEIGPFPGKSCIDAKKGSTVNLTDGIIKGNGQDGVEKGGGIYADHATVNMSGGTISGQVAEYGGGIYGYYATVYMSGGTISGQVANGGGGISVDFSTVILTGGSISNNKSGNGAGVYLTNQSKIIMKQDTNGQSCQIINNTSETDRSQYKYGEGGGIFLGNSEAVIESGTISGNCAIKECDLNGSVQGGEGGGIYAWSSKVTIKEGSELLNNNAGYRGGAICICGGSSNPSLLIVEGGNISGNTAKEGGSGIFACNDITVNVSGGKIIGNTGENNADNMKESVIMLINPTTTTWGGLGYLNLSKNPKITGSVVLSNDKDTCGFRIRVNSSLNVNEPIWVIPTDKTQDSIAVEYENETAAEKYESQFCTKKNNPKGLVRDRNTLKWTNKLKVELITITDITNKLISKTENIYILSEKVIDSNDIPAATNISGYKRTGWQHISGESSGIWDPTSPITADMQVQEIWALEAPTVTIAKEKGCSSSGIQLTAQAQHTRNDITYSYEWYKDNDNAPINDKNEETLTVSEAGTYKVKVTATSPAKYQASAEQSVEILVTDFGHSYTWEYNQTTHWRHCSVGNENTTPESHTFGDWKVTKQASIGAEGEKERTCTACGYKETATIPAIYIPSYPVTGIKVSPDTLTLTGKDETAQLTAEVIPSYADNTRVTWKSSDENVVTVDEKGKVTAVGNGTATITVTSVSGNYTATVAVTVKIPVEIERITIETEKEILTKIGESTELKVKIEPENADAQKLIWKSDDEMIAAVDENGKVTAIGNGTVIITVTTEDGKNTASITITVKTPDEPVINKTKGFGRLKVRSVNQTKTSITLEWSKLDGVDGYFVYGNRCNTRTKTYKYQKLATITNGRTWTHKNLKKGIFYKYIVKAYKIVDGKKVVTDTSASIHVITQGGKYGIARSVSVTKIGNKKNVSKITLKKGKTAQITAKEIKKDKKIRHHRNLCYESNNTAVATVTPEGLIQAVGKGTCTIWVYAQNGVYAALTVTVK